MMMEGIFETLLKKRLGSTRLWSLLLLVNFAVGSVAAPPKSDADALATLFGDDSLRNVLEIHRRSLDLSTEDRYVLLRDTVFPPNRPVIRIDFEYSPSHVPDNVAKDYGLDDPWTPWRSEHNQSRNARGGELLAPLNTLVETATILGKLEEVRELARSRTTELNKNREALAVELLVAIANGEVDSASNLLQRFERQIDVRGNDELGAETVVLWNAALVPDLQSQANDLAHRFYQEIAGGKPIHSETWRRHLFAMTYLLQWQQHHPEAAISTDALQTNNTRVAERWHLVTRQSSETNGNGYPLALWRFEPGRIESLTGHDHDYLYYDIPLTGDFTVEADVSPFGFGDTRLGFGGIWAGPGYDHRSILNGHFAADRSTIPLEPKLDEVGKSIRFRLDVQDGQRTTLINGRPVFEHSVSPSDPWLSIFSYWYTHGWTENLRISGDIEIPEEIELASCAEMVGWNDYLAGTNSEWQHLETKDGPVLSSPSHPELAGSFQESLLQYHRPMLEDGTISYEFYYEQGRSCVSPALDRLAFLMNASGVKTHVVTNGRLDRLSQRPDNLSAHADHTGIVPPLIDQSWNRLQIQTIGNTVRVRVNDTLVVDRPIPESNARTFGLFHYSDQTEARVRRIRWKGEWPKSVPAVLKQSLANDEVESILASDAMKESFEHNFAAGLGLDKFQSWGSGIRRHPNGMNVIRKSDGSHSQTVVSPQVQLAGDFDIVAEFEGFDAEIANGGDSNIHLLVGFEEAATECFVYRKFTRYAKPEGQQVVQAAYFYTREDERVYQFPAMTSEASRTGTLKLARRGNKLHYLYAADDSNHFRLLHTESVPTGQTKLGGLRLISEATRTGHVAATWTSIAIRAEGISGLASKPSLTVPQLDESRKTLPESLEIDFADPKSSRLYRVFGKGSKFLQGADGLTIAAPGFKNWEGHFVTFNSMLVGDFDIALDLTVNELADPGPGGESVVLIQAEVPDENRTYVETKFAKSADGTTGGEVQIRNLKPDGQFDYQELVRIPIDAASQLRLARRGGMAYFLLTEPGASNSRLLGRLELGTLPINPGFLRIIVHTAGEGKESSVLLKKMTLQAQQVITPTEQTISSD